MRPVIYLTEENPLVARDLASAFLKNGYEVVDLPSAELAASIQGRRGKVLVLANADRGGLDLARKDRAIRADAGVIYTASAAHRIPETARVRSALMLRSPAIPNQLVGLAGTIAG